MDAQHEIGLEGSRHAALVGGDEWFDTTAIPTGFRFLPTDEELITHYLLRKILEQPLPPNRFKEVDLYSYTPEQLDVEYGARREKEMYFFTQNKLKYAKGSRPNREARGGSWRASTPKIPIKDDEGNEIGHKMLLNYRRTGTKGNTSWLMYEYTVPSNSNKMDGYVLCKVYNKDSKVQLKSKEHPEELQGQQMDPITADLHHHNTEQQGPHDQTNNFHQQVAGDSIAPHYQNMEIQEDYQSMEQEMQTFTDLLHSNTWFTAETYAQMGIDLTFTDYVPECQHINVAPHHQNLESQGESAQYQELPSQAADVGAGYEDNLKLEDLQQQWFAPFLR